jgi:pimeloyl-ACP methyl ester carboxylesterase
VEFLTIGFLIHLPQLRSSGINSEVFQPDEKGRCIDMGFQISRRDLLRVGGGTAAGFATGVFVGETTEAGAFAQTTPVRNFPKDYKEDLFYREDWLGEPWRKPESAVLIHGNDESSTEWYAWVPRMAQQYRLIRPDLPGLGHSKIPAGFEYSLRSLAAFVIQAMDRAGIESAHIIGAKTGGSVAMRLAADYPKRTRSLVAAGGPFKPLDIKNPSPIPQRDRLGSAASKEMIEYWNQLFSTASAEGTKGLNKAMSNFDLAQEGALQKITAPTLIITADQTKMHSVEDVRAHQRLIPNSRLVVIQSDAYHIAAANADECVKHTLAFLRAQAKG